MSNNNFQKQKTKNSFNDNCLDNCNGCRYCKISKKVKTPYVYERQKPTVKWYDKEDYWN